MSRIQAQNIPYGRQAITDEDIEAVSNVLRSAFLTQGPEVPAFEKAVAQKVEAKHGIATNSATSALHIACLALELGPGDRLWTSPITFVASANCGRYCGAEIDFVDIDPSTGLMCTDSLHRKLERAKKDGALPKALIPVHLAGSSCDMATIAKMAEDYRFKVIEDASHAVGGEYDGKPVGNCRYSDITIFSFHPVKIITTGEGGLATTNNASLAQKMAELRSHGIVREKERFEQKEFWPWTYEQQQLGFNYRITDIQAALGRSQLKRLESIVTERNRLLQRYRELLSGLPATMLKVPRYTRSAVHLGVVLLQQATAQQHKQVFQAMRAAKIGVQLHYSPVHLQPYYRSLGFVENQFPKAEAYAKQALSLPLYPGLTDAEQDYVVEVLARELQTISSKDRS